MRFLRSLLFLIGVLVSAASDAAEPTHATVYKDPTCGCCAEYVEYLRQNGFHVDVVETRDLPAVKQRHSVPEALEGCHSTIVGGYVVEGHVPVTTLRRLLSEKP